MPKVKSLAPFSGERQGFVLKQKSGFRRNDAGACGSAEPRRPVFDRRDFIRPSIL